MIELFLQSTNGMGGGGDGWALRGTGTTREYGGNGFVRELYMCIGCMQVKTAVKYKCIYKYVFA